MVALDATDFSLFRLLDDTGVLPSLASFRRRASTRRVQYADDLTDDSIWASIQYGCNLGHHGRYFWRRDSSDGKGFDYCEEGEDDLASFWMEAAELGRKIAIFDMPKMSLSKPVGGLQVSNWLAHGRYRDSIDAYPAQLADEIAARFGNAPPTHCLETRSTFSATEIDQIEAELLESVALKHAAAVYYLESEPWDLFMTAFKEIHCASHLLWHLRPTRSAGGAPSCPSTSAFSSIFRRIDQAIGELIEKAGPGVEICIFSTTSMTDNSSIDDLATQLVERLQGVWSGGIRGLFRGPPFHQLPFNEQALAVRVARKWRPHASSISEALVDSLMSVRVSATGNPVFRSVTRPPERWPGPRAERLPDLIFHLAENIGQPASVSSEELGTVEAKASGMRSGNHGGDGFCLLSDGFARMLPPGRVPLEAFGPAAVGLAAGGLAPRNSTDC